MADRDATEAHKMRVSAPIVAALMVGLALVVVARAHVSQRGDSDAVPSAAEDGSSSARIAAPRLEVTGAFPTVSTVKGASASWESSGSLVSESTLLGASPTKSVDLAAAPEAEPASVTGAFDHVEPADSGAMRPVRAAFSGAEGDATAESGVGAAEELPEPTPEERAYLSDVSALAQLPHRLSGSKYGQQAAAYIERRLRQLGFQDVAVLDMPVWYAKTNLAELQVGDAHLKLQPLRPNVTVLPVTVREGISGPVIYVGRGRATDYGNRVVAGAIVAIDYDSADEWKRAFALGAQAVIFVGRGDETSLQPKHAGIPANLPRFYVREAELAKFDLRKDCPRATLKSSISWESSLGRNIVARVPGTEPDFAPDRIESEALVLAAHYDSFGIVPDLSQGARGAANVANLIEAGRLLLERRPRRDVLLLFVDNQAHYHQGAREVYDALLMSGDQHSSLVRQHASEERYLRALKALLEKRSLYLEGKASDPDTVLGLKRALAQQANFARDDVRKEVEIIRLRRSSRRGGVTSEQLDRADALLEEALRWDEIRRALHKDRLAAFVRDTERQAATGANRERAKKYAIIFEELRAGTQYRLESRLQELRRVIRIDGQREALRSMVANHRGKPSSAPRFALHVDFNFGDAGARWGAAAGDYTHRLFPWRPPKAEGDNPGYYGRVLNALADAAKVTRGLVALDTATLSDPSWGVTFASGTFISSGAIAGGYGVYNISLLSGYDRRPRDGHPADTLDRLNWRRIRSHALEATELLRSVASEPEISLPSVIKVMAKSKYPGFDRGQVSGDYVGLQVSGSLKEDRPAAGALLAMWPGNTSWKAEAWLSLADSLVPADFEPIVYEPVDETGRIRVIGLREDVHSDIMTLGTVSDERGQVIAISTMEKQSQKLTAAMRVNLFFADGYAWTAQSASRTQPQTLKVLNATSDAPFRGSRALWGKLGDHGFVYVSDRIVDYRLKLFQPLGVVALGAFDAQHPYGTGIEPEILHPGHSLSARTAEELWQLNEGRLSQLREHGVTSADLEILHSRAKRALDQGKKGSLVANRDAAFARSASLSQHVYLPLRSAMDDLVHAIVILLLLAIPFAFAIERLTLCATNIYGRIGGFVAAFLATFGLLYWLHPGFAIAATPAIIFLAFAIVLLSSLVIYIVIRKFKTELKAMQGQAMGVHGLEIPRMGTMLAAVGMGLSTMRRRPMRTTLTATTVVMLTFTILAFASFSRQVGVRALYEGPPSDLTRESILLRKLDYSAILPAALDMLQGQEGEGGLIVPHYWQLRPGADSERFSVADPKTGESLILDAVMGVASAELDRWPELLTALGNAEASEKKSALDRGEVFLPPIVQELFKLAPGEEVLLNGSPVRFAGAIDSAAMERLRHLDGESVIPVDFQSALTVAASGTSTVSAQADETQLILADEVDRDFIHLSADQVAVASNDLVRRLGGHLHAITVYPGDGVNAAERGRRLSELVVMPVWARGVEGVERLVFTVLTEVSGGIALFVPLLLGGLIIFGTLLGSISDREREIYTFSALGLSPGHVGALFFAEATVYAVIGGMGGQLLAQIVALSAGLLSNAGYISPTSINYSSTNSLFAIGIVMLTVLVSAIYPAIRASKSANPGLARSWKLPAPDGDRLKLVFPFTVSAYDITGVVSFLAEHFRHHEDAGLGEFAASFVDIGKSETGNLELEARLALAPFDLGVTQKMVLTATASEIPGVDEVGIDIERLSGTRGDWIRANHVFVKNLRRQFLLWRTLSSDMIEQYRMRTLSRLGESGQSDAEAG